MKYKAQSLIEFAIILMSVTVVAVISLHIVDKKINSQAQLNDTFQVQEIQNISQEETNCTKMGLHWDKSNGICEAK